MVMQILVKVETGFNCNWRNIEPLQPEGFKGQTANEKETLKNSIVKNGFHDAFDVWKHDNKLLSIDGVHRKIALLELSEQGYEIPEQLPCAYIDAKDEAEAAIIILSRNSQHSHILSAAVMTAAFKIPAATIEAVVPQKNIEAWSESDNSITEQLTAEEDDFEFEEGGIETDIVIGDLFEIGAHRLLCGDSTDSDAVAKLMNGSKADISFTSPPYNAGTTPTEIKMGKTSKYANDSDDKSEDEYLKLLTDFTNNTLLFSEYSFVNIQSLSGNKTALIDFLYNMKSVYADTLIWNKQNSQPAMAENVLNSQFEYVHVFSNKANRAIGTKKFRGTLSNVIEISKQTQNKVKEHNATFPIDLAAHFILNFCEKSVLDLFLGSGTTMVAAHQLNRKCYGMELEPKYCQVIIDRMKKLDPTLIIKRNGVIYE
jgi:DNA modification methylase